jgi:hypothetical protein
MIRYTALSATLTGSALVAYVFVLFGMPWVAFLLLVYCISWIVGIHMRLSWIFSLGLALLLGLSVAALYFHGNVILIYSGAFLSLCGWDLADLFVRLKQSSPEDDVSSIQKAHFRRISLLMVASLVLVFGALNIHIHLSMVLLILISLFLAIGLGIIIHNLNKIDDL